MMMQCGVWTKSNQKPKYYNSSWINKPKFAIIKPNNLKNVNILSCEHNKMYVLIHEVALSFVL